MKKRKRRKAHASNEQNTFLPILTWDKLTRLLFSAAPKKTPRRFCGGIGSGGE